MTLNNANGKQLTLINIPCFLSSVISNINPHEIMIIIVIIIIIDVGNGNKTLSII